MCRGRCAAAGPTVTGPGNGRRLRVTGTLESVYGRALARASAAAPDSGCQSWPGSDSSWRRPRSRTRGGLGQWQLRWRRQRQASRRSRFDPKCECSILTSRMCSLQDPEGTHEKSIFDRHPRTRGGLEFLQLYCTRNVHNHQTILLATRLKGPSSRSCSRAH